MTASTLDVRSYPENGHQLASLQCPLRIRSRQSRRPQRLALLGACNSLLALNGEDAECRILVANLPGVLVGCRSKRCLRFFHVLESIYSNARFGWRSLEGYSLTTSCKGFGAAIGECFPSDWGKFLHKGVLVCHIDFCDNVSWRFGLGMKSLYGRSADCRPPQALTALLRTEFS
jgi:hypothetical protein